MIILKKRFLVKAEIRNNHDLKLNRCQDHDYFMLRHKSMKYFLDFKVCVLYRLVS
jgi:hypothetical protein